MVTKHTKPEKLKTKNSVGPRMGNTVIDGLMRKSKPRVQKDWEV